MMKNNILPIGISILVVGLVTWMLIYQILQPNDVNTTVNTTTHDFSQPEKQKFVVKADNSSLSVSGYSHYPEYQVNETNTAEAVIEEKVDVVDEVSVSPPPPPETQTSENIPGGLYPGESRQGIVVSSLQEQFNAEPYDNIWAGETEQQLMDLFTKEQPEGNQVEQAACRSTFCRIEVSHADPGAEQAFFAAFALSGQYVDDGVQGYYHRLMDGNGSIKTVFYQAREGYQLPVKAERKNLQR